MFKGLPGCGKSTMAKKIINENPNKYKRINKDDLRAMLDDSNHSKDSENFILKVRDSLIILALEQGKHVIIDDTNLSPKHESRIKELIKGKATLIIEDLTNVPLETCIKNDLKRLNSVGKDVIMQMYNQFLKPKQETIEHIDGLPNAIICDLDGTLCLLNGRNPYDASNCDEDGLNEAVTSIIKDRTVLLVSGREDKYKEPTLKFMGKHNIKFKELYMRKSGDFRKDSIIKREIFDQYIRNKYNIDFVLDDRQIVVDEWRKMGLICLQVAPGDF